MELQRFTFFITFGVLICYLSFLFLKFLISTLKIEDQKLILFLKILFIISPIGFVSTNILAYSFYSSFLSFSYYIFNLYPAVVTILFIYLLLIRLLAFIPKKIFIFLFFVTILFGIINVENLKTTRIDLKNKNTPKELINKKIIHISDVHLGVLYGENYFQKIINKINSENPEIVFITGDLFDGSKGDFKNLVKQLNSIKGKVYFISGNHDLYFGIDKVNDYLNQAKVTNLDDKIVNYKSLKIAGISYQSLLKIKNQNKIFFEKEKPNIIIQHMPTNIELLQKFDPILILAGHTHNGQFFPLNVVTNLIYKGLDIGEHKINNTILFTSFGTGTWGPKFRTNGFSQITVFNLK